METLRTIWDDVKLLLKQLKDDLDIPDNQGRYWVLLAADAMRLSHILARNSGAFLTNFALPIARDATTGRRYCLLPRSIYDIEKDGGVETLCYYVPNAERQEFARITFFRTDPSRARTMYMNAYGRPTPEHPYFWREGDRLYLDGPGDTVDTLEAWLYTTLPDITQIDSFIDEPFEFPKELLHPLTMHVMNKSRLSLMFPRLEQMNDGSPSPDGAAIGKPEKTASVNDRMANPQQAEE